MSPGSEITLSGLPFRPGVVLLRRYRLQQVLGVGRTAIVYAADGRRGERVAVKALRRELAVARDERDALLHEGRLLLGFHHAYVPRLIEIVQDGPVPALVMQRIPGADLDRQDCLRPATPVEIAHRLGGAADAVAALHGRGLVHGDIKPANLCRGGNGAARLIDFGTTGPAGGAGRFGDAGRPDRVVTPVYASPQLMQGHPPAPADDVYALAVVAYELAAGRHPYGGQPPVPGDLPARPEGLGPSGWAWIAAALAHDRADRPTDPRGLAAALLADFPMVHLLRRLSPWHA